MLKKSLTKEDVDTIILFCSFARDEATEESDVDILIESKKRALMHCFV